MPMPKTRAPENDQPREALLDDLDSKSRSLLESWMNKYVAKADEIDRLKTELESIKLDRIEPLRLKLGLTKIDSDEWYIARRPGRASLDKDKLRTYLFERRVPLPVITKAFEFATSVGKVFTEIKRKKEKE